MPSAKTPSKTAAKPKVQPTSPYLTVKGADAAITLYQKAFGAKVRGRMAAQDGERVMHADLGINGGTVFLCDEFPEHGGPPAPSAESPSAVAVTIQLKKPDQVDAMFSRAVEAGCKAGMEPSDTFWDARFAMLTDPFGHRWMLNAPLPKRKAPKKKDAKKKKK
jgi:PhnB protein